MPFFSVKQVKYLSMDHISERTLFFPPIVVSLQSLNMTLQSQLNESMRSIELLQDKNEEFIKILESQKEENKRLTRQIHEKEQELLQKKQQCDIDSTKLKIGV